MAYPITYSGHKKPQDKNIMSASAMQGGRKNIMGPLLHRAAITRMWANAERDGPPAEYGWRTLLNAATFGRAQCSSAVQ